MPRTLDIQMNSFPIAGTFTISRGAKTEADVITCTLAEDGARGLGECVPYRRYGETMESVFAQIEAARPLVEAGISRSDLLSAMPPALRATPSIAPSGTWKRNERVKASPSVSALPI